LVVAATARPASAVSSSRWPEPTETFRHVRRPGPCGTSDLIAELAIVGGRRIAGNCVDPSLQLLGQLKTLEFFESPYAHADLTSMSRTTEDLEP
jgi:hypothetical protein